MAGRGAVGVWKLKITASLNAATLETAVGEPDAAVELNRVDFHESATVIFVTGTRAGAEHVARVLRGTAPQAKTSLSAVRPAEIHRLA